jgi:predicted DNA-binding transcriptional regulator AlpA
MPRKIEEAEPAGARPMSDGRAAKAGAGSERLITPKEESELLRVSTSWLAKARMRGDGPPYVPVGRSIRYTEAGNRQWIRSRQRFSTSDR